MKWERQNKSGHVNDYRQRSSSSSMGLPLNLFGNGIGGIIIMIIIFVLFNSLSTNTGQNANDGFFDQTDTQPEVISGDELADFSSAIFASTEEVWTEIFNQNGWTYRSPKMVYFSKAVSTGCGYQSSDVGPFYCSADETVYMDLTFFRLLEREHNVTGDFAVAYVIAHEVGHHVQHLLGIMQQVNQRMAQLDKASANQYLVGLELQADYFAGVWANHVPHLLEEGDIEEGLNAANAIGDDTLQQRATGEIHPESFTHGTSEQRQHWLYKGYINGTLEGGNTFDELGL